MLSRTVQVFQFLDVGREEIRPEGDGDFTVAARLRTKSVDTRCIDGFPAYLKRRRTPPHRYQVFGRVEPGKYSIIFAPTQNQSLRALLDQESSDASYLDAEFVRISRIAAMGEVPDV